MPYLLSKNNVNKVTSYAEAKIKESFSTMFVPYTATDFDSEKKIDKQMKVAVNAVLAYYGYDTLILMGGLAAAGIFACKGMVEAAIDSASSDDSFEYAGSLAWASAYICLHQTFDLLNIVSRIIATALSAASAGVGAVYTATAPVISSVSSNVHSMFNKCCDEPSDAPYEKTPGYTFNH